MCRLHHTGGHVAVLNGRGEAAAQVHALQPLYVLPGDGVAAFPEGLQLLMGHPLKGCFQPLGLLQEHRKIIHRKAVRIPYHFFGRSNNDAHGAPSFER